MQICAWPNTFRLLRQALYRARGSLSAGYAASALGAQIAADGRTDVGRARETWFRIDALFEFSNVAKAGHYPSKRTRPLLAVRCAAEGGSAAAESKKALAVVAALVYEEPLFVKSPSPSAGRLADIDARVAGRWLEKTVQKLWKDGSSGIALGWGAGSVGADNYHTKKTF